jgi:hypothetical protein
MVFLIQSTQNRDSKALHLKLDELIRAVSSARNRLVDLENCADEEFAFLVFRGVSWDVWKSQNPRLCLAEPNEHTVSPMRP